MNALEINTTVTEGYMRLLDHLSTGNKLDLLAKLTASIQANTRTTPTSFKQSFGAFQSAQSAEEIIEEIRRSRVSTRQVESW